MLDRALRHTFNYSYPYKSIIRDNSLDLFNLILLSIVFISFTPYQYYVFWLTETFNKDLEVCQETVWFMEAVDYRQDD